MMGGLNEGDIFGGRRISKIIPSTYFATPVTEFNGFIFTQERRAAINADSPASRIGVIHIATLVYKNGIRRNKLTIVITLIAQRFKTEFLFADGATGQFTGDHALITNGNRCFTFPKKEF